MWVLGVEPGSSGGTLGRILAASTPQCYLSLQLLAFFCLRWVLLCNSGCVVLLLQPSEYWDYMRVSNLVSHSILIGYKLRERRGAAFGLLSQGLPLFCLFSTNREVTSSKSKSLLGITLIALLNLCLGLFSWILVIWPNGTTELSEVM